MATPFTNGYQMCRERFRTAALAAGTTMTTHHNNVCRGPSGEELETDVAWLGPDDATKVLVTVSGTHGVEGYAGSACQLVLLESGLVATPPPDTAFLLVHALNPYGFAFDRRVNEDNVDLNRNFVDHADPPRNDHYADIHRYLVPSGWNGESRAAADARLYEIAAAKGARHLQSVVTAGQWSHPDGLFYGGTRLAWSYHVLRDVVRRHLPGRARVGYIDLHTGLGERAAGEPIFRGGRDPGAFARARAWYGAELSRSEDGTSSSTEIVGNTATLVADTLERDTELTAITLEFGTLPGTAVLNALRGDNWLSLNDDAGDDLRAAIKRDIKEAFAPDDDAWWSAILKRAEVVFAQALAGLATH